jgi:hypothetical protein
MQLPYTDNPIWRELLDHATEKPTNNKIELNNINEIHNFIDRRLKDPEAGYEAFRLRITLILVRNALTKFTKQ